MILCDKGSWSLIQGTYSVVGVCLVKVLNNNSSNNMYNNSCNRSSGMKCILPIFYDYCTGIPLLLLQTLFTRDPKSRSLKGVPINYPLVARAPN